MTIRSALFVCALAVGFPALAGAGKADPIDVQSQRSMPQIEEYVARIDQRLERGKYDVLKPKDRAWVVKEVGDLKAQLRSVDRTAAVPAELQAQVNKFETGLINLEEGGIVCERSARTGSRMAEQRCMTRKRKNEIREESLNTLRKTKIPGLPSGG